MSKSAITQTGGREATEGLIEGDVALAVGIPESPPPHGWKWTKLTNLSRLETGHTPSRQKPEYWDGDIPWIGIRDATANHGRTIADTNQHVTQEGIDNSSARILPVNTVCLSRTASVGYVVVMGRAMATSQDFVNWVCDESKLDYRFLKYVLLAEKGSFSRFSHGTTHQTIYFPEVKGFHICAPSVSEQRAIADVLAALDDKIEQNRRTARALEGLPRETFKAWFVDFEPVKAKAAGQASFPGMPPAAFASLPDSLKDSSLGPLPQGWTISTLSGVADVIMGTSPPSNTYNETGEGVPLINGPVEYGERFPLRSKWTTSEVKRAASGDLIFCVRGSTTGRRVISDGVYGLGRGVCSIRGREGAQPFVNFLIEQELPRLLAGTTGSVFPSLSAPDLKGFEVIRPSAATVSAFCSFASPLIKTIDAGFRESETLAALRDYLLPRLLSGRVRVRIALPGPSDRSNCEDGARQSRRAESSL